MKQFLYEFLCYNLCENITYYIKTFLVGDVPTERLRIQSKTIEDYEYEFEMKMRGKKRWRKYTV
jgi:hypothetical protein